VIEGKADHGHADVRLAAFQGRVDFLWLVHPQQACTVRPVVGPVRRTCVCTLVCHAPTLRLDMFRCEMSSSWGGGRAAGAGAAAAGAGAPAAVRPHAPTLTGGKPSSVVVGCPRAAQRRRESARPGRALVRLSPVLVFSSAGLGMACTGNARDPLRQLLLP
jgi:hypothetical protein